MTALLSVALLSVTDVTVRFGALEVLDAVSFDVPSGSIFGLIGPNGAGKTTLFNCVSGLLRPTSGTVSFDGHRIDRLAVHRRARRGIARTFQNLNLFGGLTVRENVMVPVDVRERRGVLADAFVLPASRFGEGRANERAVAILHLLDLEAYSAVLAADLPVGLQRRVEIARALASRPQLLLLDEPASGLDGAETTALARLLPVIRERFGVTILLVDHDMALVLSVCDRICALDAGQVVRVGTPTEVRNDARVIASYLGAAAG